MFSTTKDDLCTFWWCFSLSFHSSIANDHSMTSTNESIYDCHWKQQWHLQQHVLLLFGGTPCALMKQPDESCTAHLIRVHPIDFWSNAELRSLLVNHQLNGTTSTPLAETVEQWHNWDWLFLCALQAVLCQKIHTTWCWCWCWYWYRCGIFFIHLIIIKKWFSKTISMLQLQNWQVHMCMHNTHKFKTCIWLSESINSQLCHCIPQMTVVVCVWNSHLVNSFTHQNRGWCHLTTQGHHKKHCCALFWKNSSFSSSFFPLFSSSLFLSFSFFLFFPFI